MLLKVTKDEVSQRWFFSHQFYKLLLHSCVNLALQCMNTFSLSRNNWVVAN